MVKAIRSYRRPTKRAAANRTAAALPPILIAPFFVVLLGVAAPDPEVDGVELFVVVVVFAAVALAAACNKGHHVNKFLGIHEPSSYLEHGEALRCGRVDRKDHSLCAVNDRPIEQGNKCSHPDRSSKKRRTVSAYRRTKGGQWS